MVFLYTKVSGAIVPTETVLVPMLQYDWAVAFHNGEYRGRMKDKELHWFRWASNGTVRASLMIEDDKGKHLQAVLSEEQVIVRPRVTEKNGKPSVQYRIKTQAYVVEQVETVKESALADKVKRKIEAEVRATFANGLKHGVDVMGLGGEGGRADAGRGG